MALQQLENEGNVLILFLWTHPTITFMKKKVLELLSGSSLIHKDTLIVVEASLETDFSYIEGYGYAVVREKNYKTNKHIFLKIK